MYMYLTTRVQVGDTKGIVQVCGGCIAYAHPKQKEGCTVLIVNYMYITILKYTHTHKEIDVVGRK